MIRWPLGASSVVDGEPLARRRDWGLTAPFSIRHHWFPRRRDLIVRRLLREDLLAIRCLRSMSRLRPSQMLLAELLELVSPRRIPAGGAA